MGLMDQAIETANDTAAKQATTRARIERERGAKLAEKFTHDFGLDATWIDRVTVVDYQKKYRDFGGHEWRKRERVADRLQVDDIVIGITEKTYSTSSDYIVWRPCPDCGLNTPVTLACVTPYVHKPDDHRAKLIYEIGKVMTSDKPCTVCQARPCECCGRSN